MSSTSETQKTSMYLHVSHKSYFVSPVYTCMFTRREMIKFSRKHENILEVYDAEDINMVYTYVTVCFASKKK